MTLPIKLLDEAELEAVDAIDWYESRELGLGTALREALEAAMSSVQDHPLAFPVVFGSNIRRAQVNRFHYSIFFTIQTDRILVYSIFHNRRNPIVWQGRVD
jgi:toxin ParE1/3/4